MSGPQRSIQNELQAARAFGKQAAVFDALYAQDPIIQYKRQRVRDHMDQYLRPQSRILELNAGTGEDAIYFARLGHHVHATDISAGMLLKLEQKVQDHGLGNLIKSERCAFTELDKLDDSVPYDHIFSNFAGLNCTDRLDTVLASFSSLLQKDGMVTLVILPKFCLWECLLLFKGKFRTAFRRFANKKGAKSHIEGEYFTCSYYDPAYVVKQLAKDFNVVSIEGLCTLVPPSYMQGFAEKNPRLYPWLQRAEDYLKSYRPWRSIGDYYIISLRKK